MVRAASPRKAIGSNRPEALPTADKDSEQGSRLQSLTELSQGPQHEAALELCRNPGDVVEILDRYEKIYRDILRPDLHEGHEQARREYEIITNLRRTILR